MSKREYRRVQQSLKPFMQLVLVVSCLVMLGGCIGGGGGSTKTGAELLPEGKTSFAIASNLSDAIDDGRGGKVIKNEIILLRKDDVTDTAASAFINNNNWAIVRYSSVTNTYRVKTDSESLDQLNSQIKLAEESGLFEYVTSNNLVILDSALSNQLDDTLIKDADWVWNYDAINLANALPLASNYINIIPIGIADGAFRNDHKDIIFDKIISNDDIIVEIASQCPEPTGFIFKTHDCKKAADHGMAVAGIIGAIQNNGKLTAGISTQNRIIAAEIWAFDDQAPAIEQLFANGARVINLSQNNRLCAEGACSVTELDYAVFRKKVGIFAKQLYKMMVKYDPNGEVLIVASSGNSGDYSVSLPQAKMSRQPTDLNGLIPSILSDYIQHDLPAPLQKRIADQSIITGAYYVRNGSKKRSPGTMLPYSSGTEEAFIIAPGGYFDAVSTNVDRKEAIGVLLYDGDSESVGAKIGTSFAAPHVTGVAALVLQVNPLLTAAQVKEIVLVNSDTVDGYRALNAEKAVRAAIASLNNVPTVSFSGSPTSIKINDVVTFTPTATSANGAITTYNWSFGDGETSETTVGSSVQHVYTTSGTYTVQLTVTDVVGRTNLANQTVTVDAVGTATASGTFSVTVNSLSGSSFTPPSGKTLCTFNASGDYMIAPSGPSTNPAGYGDSISGFSKYPGRAGGLIMRMGNAYYDIGTSKTIAITTDSVDFLVNDFPNGYADNTGSASVTYSCTENPDFEDTFTGSSFSSNYWTTRGGAQCGGSQVTGGYATFNGGTNADTQGKREFSGSKIVVEAVMAGTQSNRDTHFELIDTVSGDVIQIGDTSYGGYGLYIAAAGQYAIGQQGLSPTTSSFKSYRLSVQGKFVTIQRGDSFENMEGATYEMGASIAGRSFYLRIGTGASDCVYSPGTFDMVRVITTPN